jgi:hypothetical protein
MPRDSATLRQGDEPQVPIFGVYACHANGSIEFSPLWQDDNLKKIK